MKGFPKVLNTKEDYEISCRMAKKGLLSRDSVKRVLEKLAATEKYWVFDRVLGVAEAADAGARVIEQDVDGVAERHQYILQTDVQSRLVKSGLSLAEVQTLISNLEV